MNTEKIKKWLQEYWEIIVGIVGVGVSFVAAIIPAAIYATEKKYLEYWMIDSVYAFEVPGQKYAWYSAILLVVSFVCTWFVADKAKQCEKNRLGKWNLLTIYLSAVFVCVIKCNADFIFDLPFWIIIVGILSIIVITMFLYLVVGWIVDYFMRKTPNQNSAQCKQYAYHWLLSIVLGLVIGILLVVGFTGSQMSIARNANPDYEQQFQIMEVGGTTYAVIYNNGESAILEECVLPSQKSDTNELIVYTNVQKVISVQELEYVIYTFFPVTPKQKLNCAEDNEVHVTKPVIQEFTQDITENEEQVFENRKDMVNISNNINITITPDAWEEDKNSWVIIDEVK